MKKYILLILLVLLVVPRNVFAEDEKLKVIMFNAPKTISEEEALEKIKLIEGYNETFELIILNTVELKGNEDGTDKFNEEYYNLFKKAIDQYNEANGTDLAPTQYPTFLVGNEICPGTGLLEKAIKKMIKKEVGNETYNCLLSNSKYNCFNNEKIKPQKRDITLLYSLSLIIVIAFLMWLALKK